MEIYRCKTFRDTDTINQGRQIHQGIGDVSVTILPYVDDAVLLAPSPEEFQHMINVMKEEEELDARLSLLVKIEGDPINTQHPQHRPRTLFHL
jgi:hypothetical protein